MTDLADFLTVRHNRISLALHRLRDADGRPAAARCCTSTAWATGRPRPSPGG